MIVREYKARKGSRFSDADAAVIGPELDRTFGPEAPRTPEGVVRKAQSARSKLHPYFTWDDDEAGRAWRLQEARLMLNSLEILVIGDGQEPRRTRAMHHVVVNEETHESAYVVADIVFANSAYSEQVVDKARRELEGWTHRFEEYAELGGAIPLVRKAVEALAV